MKTYKVEYEWNKRKGSIEIIAKNIVDLRKQLIEVELGGYEYYTVYHKNWQDAWVYSGTMTKSKEIGFTMFFWDNGRVSYEIRDDGELYR